MEWPAHLALVGGGGVSENGSEGCLKISIIGG